MAQDHALESAGPAGVILERGQTISRFVVLSLVGRGGMGEVYAAYDPELDRKVAIKLLRAQGQRREDADSVEAPKLRLLREAQATAKLQHPNVVVVYDVGTFGESVFIAMEFIEGQTMSAWLGAAPRSRREIVDVYLAAGRGLSAAHAAGLVHRDFKPDNVMVTSDGQVRVMDFGLARHVGDKKLDQPKAEVASAASPREVVEPMAEGDAAGSSRYLAVKLTQTGAMLGTPAYMSPEQFAGAPTDARTDQFSFCVALYEALYGERPFAGENVLALMTNVTTGAPSPPPPKARVPNWLRKVLLRGLATSADGRFPSMASLLAALQTDPTARTRRLIVGGVALAALVVSVLAGRRAGVEARIPLCGAGAQRIAGVWGAPGTPSPRRTAIERAFSATRHPVAKQSFAAVARYLDEYASAWLGAYRDACEATHVRGEQSSEVLDLRMGCLNDRLVELHALTDELAGADANVVQNAMSGASTLGPIDRCGDVRLLRAVVRPPSDQATSQRVEKLQAQRAKLYASTVKARCKTTHAIERDLLEGARAVKYGPLLAETLLACGKVEDTCGASAETLVGFYQEAFTTALSSGHDQVAAESAALIASTLADKERQLPAARQWHAISHAIVTHMGGAPFVEVALDQAAGLIAQHAHEKETSLAALERARAGTAKLRGPEHPFVGLILNAEGLTLHDAGEDKRALDLLRSAEEILWNVVGPDHPWVAGVLANEGDVLNSLQRHVEAHAAFEMAMTIWTKEKAEPARIASAQTGLGVALLGEGKAREAIAPLEQALAARADKTTPRELAGETRFALARAAWSKPSERPRALALARAARHDYEAVSDGTAQAEMAAEIAAEIAAIDAWLRAPAAKL